MREAVRVWRGVRGFETKDRELGCIGSRGDRVRCNRKRWGRETGWRSEEERRKSDGGVAFMLLEGPI